MKPEEVGENMRLKPGVRHFWTPAAQAVSSLLVRIGLDGPTALKMLKAALNPTIIVAMHQSTAVANIDLNFGYLSALITVASQCLLPRGKFVKTIFFNLLAVSVSAAISCLALYCSIKARGHGPGSDETYNSSACAVSGVFLVFTIWLSNTLRAYRPSELQDAMVAFSIFAGISLTHTGRFTTIASGLEFEKELLCAFMFGFSIATGVSLLILPITSRRNFFAACRAYQPAIEKVLEAFHTHVASLRQGKVPELHGSTSASSQVAALTSSAQALQGLHDKLHGDLFYATHEVAWGKLSATDLTSIFARLRSILLPVVGMAMTAETLERCAKGGGLVHANGANTSSVEIQEKQEGRCASALTFWQDCLTSLENDTNIVIGLVRLGIQHSLMALDMSQKAHIDPEVTVGGLCPGHESFTREFNAMLDKIQSRHHNSRIGSPFSSKKWRTDHQDCGSHGAECHGPSSEETLIAVAMDNLQDAALAAVADLVDFAETKQTSGQMERNRLILPDLAQTLEWLTFKAFRAKKAATSSEDNDEEPDELEETSPSQERSDTDHLPATNTWQRFGNRLRKLSAMMSSDQSIFGFRVACAAMTCGILAYLHQTQEFYIRQRLVWVWIVMVIGMNPGSGASIFGFIWRILGTIGALAVSLCVYYIADGKTAGVIVLLYLGNVFLYYFYVKYPQMLGPCVISIVTMNIIIAYEMQVHKLGIAESESGDEPYYPVYLFGTYKLVCVIVGCGINLIWVVFPYPNSTGSIIRKIMGRSLFTLANFYGYVHTTIDCWISEEHEQAEDVDSALQRTRKSLFAEQMSLLTALRKQIGMTKYEPTIGGKYPRSTYSAIVTEIQSITFGMAIMVALTKSSAKSLNISDDDVDDKSLAPEDWKGQFAHLITSTDFNSHRITQLLCHLSAAVASQTAVPPFLAPPEPFPIARSLRKTNQDILHVDNARDPAFRAFATMEVMSSIVSDSIKSLTRHVVSLVGELDFEMNPNRRRKRT